MVSLLLVGGHWCQWTFLMRGWFQSASHHQQRHHGSPPIVSLGHVVVCLLTSAHGCAGDLPHLPVQGRRSSWEMCSP